MFFFGKKNQKTFAVGVSRKVTHDAPGGGSVRARVFCFFFSKNKLFLLLLTAASPWSQAALQDLAAMHDMIRDNHPGPVDSANSSFRTWLDGGEASLLPQARAVRSLHDYQLVLRDYANGFADGHLSVTFNVPEAHFWPGFLVRADALGALPRVAVAEGDSGVRVGATVESCGGVPARDLLRDRVQRPGLNPHVPQRMRLASTALMVADADDPRGQWRSCVVSTDGRPGTVALRWRPIGAEGLAQARIAASGIDIPQAGLRHVGDVWLISMPSFAPQTDTAAARLQALVAAVTAQAGELHAARHVVLDVRGNDGGDDDWGTEVAAALWGKAAVASVEASMPTAIDWRVSPRNAAAIRALAAMLRAQGQGEGAAYFAKRADEMDHAVRRHDLFMHEPADPLAPAPHLTSPFAHPVYVLTTQHCASACLDFLDLLNGLPGAVRIGFETSSDTDYLEVAKAALPSGDATLRYAMKVYRQRMRGANVSYKPTIAWPGGEVDDASVVKWIDSLP
jgi:hypothetical protein